MWKFLVTLGTGLTLIMLGVIAVGLGFLNAITAFIVGGLLCMLFGVAAIWLSAQLLLQPAFLRTIIMSSINRGKWTNTLCPICGWWMRMETKTKPGVTFWYCVNPNHPGTIPQPPTGGQRRR